MENLLFIIIFCISCIQSIAGVGILVLGTPLMLFFDYNIIDTMFFLLPISMTASLLNLIVIRIIFKLKKNIDFKLFKYFFIFCFPSICLGLWLVKNYTGFLNINILVATIIFISVLIKIKSKKLYILERRVKKLITLIIGFIHGLTNSGGTLLTLFLLKKDEKFSNISRFEIHLFYLLLASTQFAFLNIIEDKNFIFEINNLMILTIILLSTLLGNLLANKLKNLTQIFIYVLAIFSAIALIFKNFFSA